MSTIAIKPLTPDRWDDFVALFETDSMCRNCWCMLTRPSAAVRRQTTPADRRKMMAALVKDGPPPGVLAYDEKGAVGWLAVAPRSATPDWNVGRKASASETPDDAEDPGVWAATCFFVRKDARGAKLTEQLLEGGVAHARKSGARVIEACPMSHDDKRSVVGMCVGPKRIFDRAGFETVLERKPGRPLVRLTLKPARSKP